MSDHRDLSTTSLPPSVLERVDKVCNSFDAAWKTAASTGPWPCLEEYLGDRPEPERAALLRELLKVELEYGKRKGVLAALAEYQRRFPKDRELVGAVYR